MDVYLDDKMDFQEHLRNTFKEGNRTISLLRKLQYNVPRAQLVTISKFFIGLRLDYGELQKYFT